MTKKVLIPLAVAAVAVGVWIWWQQGGVGGPVSEEAARRYFARIVAAAEAKDFDALCRLNSSVGTCEFEMRAFCRPPTGGPLNPGREELERWCRASVPEEPPEIVSSTYRPGRDGSVGGRLLVVKGTDGYGRPYETEVLIFRDKRSYKATHALFWSGSKFPTDDGTTAEPEA